METTTTSPRRLVDQDVAVDLDDVAAACGLWAACALPGDGPEYRFAAAPRSRPRSLLRRLVRMVREVAR